MATLLYQQSNVEIVWNDEDKWLEVSWIGRQTGTEVQRDCEQLLRMMVAKNTDAVLNDNGPLEGPWVTAAESNAVDWFARMRKAGLRHFAWVYAPTHVGKVSVDAVFAQLTPGSAQHFLTKEKAVAWLRNERRRASAATQRIVIPPGLLRR